VDTTRDQRRHRQAVAVADLLQVMTLMAVPAVLFGLIGYLNRRADRRPTAGAPRNDTADPPRNDTAGPPRNDTVSVPTVPRPPDEETVDPGTSVRQARRYRVGSARPHTAAGQPVRGLTESSVL
jgi:hypothetical protein